MDGGGESLLEGLYEALITENVARRLHQAPLSAVVGTIPDEEQPHVLARHVRDAVWRSLAGTKDPERRLAIVNEILERLPAPDDVVQQPRQLLALHAESQAELPRPATPLSDAALLTNAYGEPSLGSELRAELATADEVDLLCAFVKWHGLRLLEQQLGALRDLRRPLRVLTTTYVGATERAALDRLVGDFGAQVKVQYDALRTRLHAKAWLFRRNTGYDTAYVGSSNLSRSALLEGVEWNVRLSRVATPGLLDKFGATFDSYWNDETFELYDPDRDRDRLDDALAEASGRRRVDRLTLTLSGLEVRPYAYQQEMLEALEVERTVHGRHRNLVVAATGTGKTVVAALDYRGLCHGGTRPSLLFVAHRREILEQSRRTYREVLNDASFGEVYAGGSRPERWQHVFATVQSLSSYDVHAIPTDRFDVVVIDEFHHAEAATYRRILDHLKPRELLGLTATPERADGIDVRRFFDGRTAAELRLWDALGAELLCPFHYFGVADGTDLRGVGWTRGRYDEGELGNLYTGNDRRAAIVLRQLRDKVADLDGMRALGFCVSVAHAEYMARVFREAGIPALAVSGMTSVTDRQRALADLRGGQVKVLFAADLFNEGLDLPDINTVLFLRPTESATVFLQQLGRGLRQAPGKAVLTVLDFVGHHRHEFRFDARYRALTGATRRGLQDQVEQGFPFLPGGSQILLDRQAQELVLENIRAQISTRWGRVVAELRSYGDQGLATFLHESGLDLADLLRSRSWTRLRRDAGLPTRSGGPHESHLLKRVRAVRHVDDGDRGAFYRRMLADDPPSYQAMAESEQRLARMLFFALWPNGGGFASYDDGFRALRREAAARDELSAVVDLALDGARHVARPMSGIWAASPLRVHARYTREEILAALDYATLSKRPSSFQAGVVYSASWDADAFLVTLKKTEQAFSPTTMYRDYAVSPSLFHWESQSATSVASPTGQRYLNGHSTVLLFAREVKVDEYGSGAPYLFLGPARYVAHTGDRPIAVTWRLAVPMPADVYARASVAAA